MHRRVLGAAIIGVSLAASLVGCTTIPSSEDEPVVFSGSLPTQYLKAEDLAGDATELVFGEVVGATEQKISDLTVTRYDLRIDQTLGGSVRGTVGVYQTGTDEWILDMPLPQHLKVGEEYLLFLIPMGLPSDAVGSDGFGIVGTGVWVEEDGLLKAYGNPDTEIDYGQIPQRLTLDQATSLLAVDELGGSSP